VALKRRHVVTAGVVVVAAAALGVGLFRPAGTHRSGPVGGQPGQIAPLFTTTDLDGHPIALQDYRGVPVVLNFWASWCVPCRTEFPVLKALRVAHPDVVVLGVVFQDGEGSARDFLRSEGATWPGLRDPSGQIASAYRVGQKPGIPVSILVDAGGRVRARHLGPLTDSRAAEALVRS
jgi:cytochrome c biogenesis protein CcmG/thiol:disulfide interchange protein DsbE